MHYERPTDCAKQSGDDDLVSFDKLGLFLIVTDYRKEICVIPYTMGKPKLSGAYRGSVMEKELGDDLKDKQSIKNPDNPQGLMPVETAHGGPFTVQVMPKDAREKHPIYPGDVVRVKPDENISAKGIPGQEEWAGVSLNFGAASTTSEHLVIVDPLTIFQAQDNGEDEGFHEEDSGKYANLELNDGDPIILVSGHQIDCSTLSNEGDRDTRVLGLYGSPHNTYGPNARIRVMIHKHRLNAGVPKAKRPNGRPPLFESKSAFDAVFAQAIRIILAQGKRITEAAIALEIGTVMRKEDFSDRMLRKLLAMYYPDSRFEEVVQEFL